MTQGTEQFGVRIDQAACPSCGGLVDLSAAQSLTVIACPACQGRLFVPVQLGQYRLVGLLGKGTTASAYRAIDQGLDRPVAVKLMHLESKGDDDSTNRFLGEARALAALRHRNVVRIFTMGREQNIPYLVMELVGGGSLRNIIYKEKDKPIEEHRALEIAIGVAEGLQAAYAIGLIHGDVKPANILLDEQGVPKIVDFGLARFGGVRMEREGMGTPFYVAPERIRQKDTDHRSDIYSLGATLFHLLTSLPVFDGETVKSVLLAHIRKPAPDIRHYRQFLGAKTAALVAKMLQKDPAQRYATYDELLVDLRAAMQCAMPPSAKPPAEPPPTLAAAAAAAAADARPAGPAGRSAGSTARPAAPPSAGTGAKKALPVTRQEAAKKELYKLVAIVVGVIVAAAAVGGICLLVFHTQRDTGAEFNMYPKNKPPPPREDEDSDNRPGDSEEKRDPPEKSDSDGSAGQSSGLIPQTKEGEFVLLASLAKIESTTGQPKYESGKDCLGFWNDPNAKVSWKLDVVKGGEFHVILEHACAPGSEGGSFILSAGPSSLTHTVVATADWNTFDSNHIGKLTLPVGQQGLVLAGQNRKLPNGKYAALINLRAITLRPAKG